MRPRPSLARSADVRRPPASKRSLPHLDPSPETGPMTRPAACRRRLRTGFTLIELLIVIIIIGILIALLIPAIASAVRAARNASVQAETNQLAQALADFKSKMGDYPPSRIYLDESGWFNTSLTNPAQNQVPSGASADITMGQLAIRSLTAFRKFWPRVVISTTNAVSSQTQWYDFNGDGIQGQNLPVAAAGPWVLQGHECLVFFLGGVPLRSSSTGPVLGMSGFGKSPTNPFTHSIQPPPNNNVAMFSANRNPPFYDFNAGRLALTTPPVSNAITTIYSHGMPGYVDPLGAPQSATANNFFAYFSNNLGSGYDVNDVNGIEKDGPELTPQIALLFTQPGTGTTVSPSPNPYTSSLTYTSGSTASPVFYNPQSFQIVSAGIDGVYGVGGVYTPNSTSNVTGALPAYPAPTTPNTPPVGPMYQWMVNSNDGGLRIVERDNLTNFHSGKLD